MDMISINVRRIFLSLLLVLAAVMTAGAQEGLNIDKVFRLYGHSKGCKMVEMHDATLRGYRLKVYKSLTHKGLDEEIAPYLKADRQRAKKIREVVENGRIVSGYYMMPSLGEGINRYVLFSKAGHNKGAVIYIEGRLSPDDIMKLCYSSY